MSRWQFNLSIELYFVVVLYHILTLFFFLWSINFTIIYIPQILSYFYFVYSYQSGGQCSLLAFNKIWSQQHFQTEHTWLLNSLLQLQDQTWASDITFLTEALPTVVTDVRFFPRVELHVVPQRARVSQQLGADCTLHLREKTKIKYNMSFSPLFLNTLSSNCCSGEKKHNRHENLKMLRERFLKLGRAVQTETRLL